MGICKYIAEHPSNLLHSTWLPVVQLFTISILQILEEESHALQYLWHNPDSIQQQQQQQQQEEPMNRVANCDHCHTFTGKEDSTKDKGN